MIEDKVSLVIPAYNAATFIERTVESIKNKPILIGNYLS